MKAHKLSKNFSLFKFQMLELALLLSVCVEFLFVSQYVPNMKPEGLSYLDALMNLPLKEDDQLFRGAVV